MTSIDDPTSDYWTERRSGEPGSDDFRTPWHRDFGRVVHSASFRRLQGKTQLLGIDNGDFHRTRLTHSLEVSQIGISITEGLKCKLNDSQVEKKWLPSPLLIQAICLTHDLGHPPFGHGGEVALNRCMLPYDGFEGNGQTLRIITRLEKYKEQFGLDLTRRSVLGTIKYPARHKDLVNDDFYPESKQRRKDAVAKPEKVVPPDRSMFTTADYAPPKCYLDEEHKEIVMDWVAKKFDNVSWNTFSKAIYPSGNGELKHKKTVHQSLDASILNLADDIANGVHDLEDAIALNLLDRHTFEEWFECGIHKQKLDWLLKKEFKNDLKNMVSELFDGTHLRKRTIGRIVGHFVNAAMISQTSSCELSCPLLRYHAKLEKECDDALKALMKMVNAHVIKSPEVQQLEFRGQKIVTELFDAFSTDPKRLLGEQYYNENIQGDVRGKIIARAVCDYIAGMTDDYAITRYRHLFVPRAGSVFDRL